MKKIKKIPAKKKSVKKIPAKKKSVKKIFVKKSAGLISTIIELQYFLKPEFNIKINFSLERYIQAFFDNIATRISEYKTLKAEEKRRRQLEEIEKKEKEKYKFKNKK